MGQKAKQYADKEVKWSLWGSTGRKKGELDDRASLVAQKAKSLPAMQETHWPLGWEDPPEKEMASHSSMLAWRIPPREGPAGFTVHGVTKSRKQLRG